MPPISAPPSPSEPPMLSVCMIVRDEAAMLPDLLTSLAGIKCELCVVDTGSQDETLDLLAAHGARVKEQPWADDFAAARNASLALATGRWVLVLDADERLSAPLAAELQDFLREADEAGAGAALVPLRSPLPGGGQHHESALLRLFRRHSLCRYKHAIHEDVSDGVRAMLRAENLGLARLEHPILHLGYVRSHAAARGKKDRDARLLWQAVTDHPDDLYSWYKLLELGAFWRDETLSSKAAPQALAALNAAWTAAAPTVRQLHFGGDLVAALALALPNLQQHPAERRGFLLDWLRRLPATAGLCLRLGEACEACGGLDAAEAAFVAAQGFAGSERNVQLATVRPMMGRARLAMARGKLPEALKMIEAALALAPGDPEALLAQEHLRPLVDRSRKSG